MGAFEMPRVETQQGDFSVSQPAALLSPSFLLTVLRAMAHPEPVGLFAPDLMGESHQCPLSKTEALRS